MAESTCRSSMNPRAQFSATGVRTSHRAATVNAAPDARIAGDGRRARRSPGEAPWSWAEGVAIAARLTFRSRIGRAVAQPYYRCVKPHFCLYSDANLVINEFNGKYSKVGEEVKRFVERNSNKLSVFYGAGRDALRDKLHTKNDFFRMMNRFVRSPYFQGLVESESSIERERNGIQTFDLRQPGVKHEPGNGFPGFLKKVLTWRLRSVQQLGGAFVKNSLIDYHTVLIGDFEKMAFIKLEMLGRAKQSLMRTQIDGKDRLRGNVEPSRRDYRYYWSFNGEFWNDELGDYVFGLESQCHS